MRGTPYVHGDFRGGLNTKATNYLLEDSQCRDCLNVQSTITGAIVKRTGVVAQGLEELCPDAPRSLFAVESTGTDHFITSAGHSLYASNQSPMTTPIGSGFSSDTWSFVEATAQDGQGPVFLSNGTDTPQAWNGSILTSWTADASSTLPIGVPKAKHLLMHESRVLAARVPANISATGPSTLYWSEVQVGVGTLPKRWMIENQQIFDPDDGDEITGLGKAGSNVLVFKNHKVFVVYDLNTGASRRLTTNIGCVAPRSIVETPMGTIFLSDVGVYMTNGSSVDLISDQITPNLTATLNKTTAVATVFNNHYYLSFPDDSTPYVYDYDLVLKSWWRHTIGTQEDKRVFDFTKRFNGSEEELYCASVSDIGRMFVSGVYTDFGDAYPWYWKGPWLAPGQARVVYPAVRKRLKALRIDGSGTCTLKVGSDFSTVESAVTPQNPDGTSRQSLFPAPTQTSFGDSVNPVKGTYFGDYYTSTLPPSPYTTATIFGEVQGPQQSRAWGQGVARSWSLIFGDTTNTPTPAAATIQNYTIFLQERNQ